ncbi:MAG: NnrS family protein [Magnetococcus sp. DMHC-6]
MKPIIQKIFPASQPFPVMVFSRQPVVHLFWGGGLLGLVIGFSLGFFLWMWQTGVLALSEHYFLLKLVHAHVQLFGFIGSFLLGFALQAGPNVLGGHPPPSKLLLKFLPILWLGIGLSILSDPVAALIGNILITIAFAGPGYLLLRVTLAGNPLLRIPRGLPLTGAFTWMAFAPWLPLEDSGTAVFFLWCGPITAAMVAAQQLINNVMQGAILQGATARLYMVSLSFAWLCTGWAAFMDNSFWRVSGWAWLATILILVFGTRFIPSVRTMGFVGINVTLFLGVVGLFVATLMMIIGGREVALDAVVHLLGAGVMTLLIIGVASRVAGFFSGQAVVPDRIVVYILLLWSLVALTRVATSLAWIGSDFVGWAVGLGGVLLIVWGARLALRLIPIGKKFSPPKP